MCVQLKFKGKPHNKDEYEITQIRNGHLAMIDMKSYLTLTFSSEGEKPSEVVQRLHMLGFRATHGAYDFIYEWGKYATVKDAIWFSDRIHETLKGCKVLFQLETVTAEANSE